MLRSTAEEPTLLIAVSSEAWTAEIIVPTVQHACGTRGPACLGFPLSQPSIHEVNFQMQGTMKDNRILTINDVAAILRCSKTHVSHVLAGKIAGIPKLTHIAMGRRKLIRREWLDNWMETNKQQ